MASFFRFTGGKKTSNCILPLYLLKSLNKMFRQLGLLCDVRYTLWKSWFTSEERTEALESLLVVIDRQLLVNEMRSNGHLVLIYTNSEDPLQPSSSSQAGPLPFCGWKCSSLLCWLGEFTKFNLSLYSHCITSILSLRIGGKFCSTNIIEYLFRVVTCKDVIGCYKEK